MIFGLLNIAYVVRSFEPVAVSDHACVRRLSSISRVLARIDKQMSGP